MNDILLSLLSKLKERQSWCPYCGGEHVHTEECVLKGLWFEEDTNSEWNEDAADNPYIPNHLKHLPVYYWIDEHDEDEWIMDDGEGGLWHMVGTVSHLLKEQEL